MRDAHTYLGRNGDGQSVVFSLCDGFDAAHRKGHPLERRVLRPEGILVNYRGQQMIIVNGRNRQVKTCILPSISLTTQKSRLHETPKTPEIIAVFRPIVESDCFESTRPGEISPSRNICQNPNQNSHQLSQPRHQGKIFVDYSRRQQPHLRGSRTLKNQPEVGDVQSAIKLAPSGALSGEDVGRRLHYVRQGLAVQQNRFRTRGNRGCCRPDIAAVLLDEDNFTIRIRKRRFFFLRLFVGGGQGCAV